MERQTAVRQSFLNNAPLLGALFSLLVPSQLVALDQDPMRVGGYDTSGGLAPVVAVSGNCAEVPDSANGVQGNAVHVRVGGRPGSTRSKSL